MSTQEQTSITTPTKTPLLSRGAIDTLSGSAGGVALVVVGYPFDTLKVRLQTSDGRFNGMMDCVRQTIKNEGFVGFYKGVSSPLIGVTGVNAVCFFSYNQSLLIYQRLFMNGNEIDRTQYQLSPYVFAGALTGVALSFVEGPVELFKAKLQVQYGAGSQAQYTGTFDCAKKIASQYGVRGVLQGFGPTLMRNVPANVAYFGFYEYLKYVLGANTNPEKISPLTIMTAGGAAGAAYCT
jgi:solute carrier family 25 carnitine/acylcarnitine transporter 20/29